MTVTGSVGAYPLKWTRVLNTRAVNQWSHSYAWGMWVMKPQEYEFQDPPYEGPIGGVTYPDGRTMDMEGNFTYPTTADSREPQDLLIEMGNGTYDIFMRDGGRVKFRHPAGMTGEYDPLIATEIVDPYGQTTLLQRDVKNRLWKIVEPGGRYLQINYTTNSRIYGPTGETLYWDVISSVQAYAAPGQLVETVTYNYNTVYSFKYTNTFLTQANYGDGTRATYTYQDGAGNVAPTGMIRSCDDVRYDGAMSRIAYEYATANDISDTVAVGQIKREKNLTTGQTVSELIYPRGPFSDTPTVPDPRRFVRTEQRGDGATRTFQYHSDGTGDLESYTDFKNQRSYIEFGPLITTIGPTGVPSYSFIKTLTDARGYQTKVEKSAVTGALLAVTHPDTSSVRHTYSNANTPYYVISSTNENGKLTRYTRNPGTNTIQRIDYPDTGYETFTYNARGQVLIHRLTSGGTEIFEYDNGANNRGLKTRHWAPATPSDPAPAPTVYLYYQTGPHTDRLLSVTDSRGNTTSYQYNLRGQVTKLTHPDGTYTESGYNADGTLAWASNELRYTTSYTYDEYKRVLTTTDPLNRTTTMSYALDSAWANPLLHTTTSIKYVSTPSGKSTVFDYDANFRKIDQVSALGTTEEAWTLFAYDPVGNLIRTTDPRGKLTTFAYDNRNRQVTVTDALNRTTTTVYDVAGNKTKVTHPDARFVQYLPDSMNRVIQQTDEKGVITKMGYDAAGNLLWNDDGKTNRYSYIYDDLNRRTQMTYPNLATEKYSYDAAGNLKTYTNRAGDIQTFLYDNRNRQTRFDWDDGVTTWQTTVYDAASRVTQITNANATIKNLYFNDNSLKSQEEWTVNYADNFHRTVTYAYDADGNRANVIYPSGKDFSYGYTGRNQLWYVMDDLSGIYQAVFVYDLAGNMTTRYVGNNWIVTDASQRDAVNQITRLEHRLVGTMRSFDYTFNARGSRLTSKPDGGTAQNYGYDPAQQVTSAPLNGATQTFTYDNNGNRTGTNGGVYASNNLNQYTTFNNLGATYDLNGNLKTYNGWTYSYDAQNRLTKVMQGATTVAQYWYDGLNRQITRNVKGAITFHVWDGWNLIEERGTGNAIQNIYLYAGDQIIENVTTKRFFFQDSLGNTSHLSDEAGNLLERYTYSAFGLPTFYTPGGTVTPGNVSTKGTRHLFQGQLWTQETGLNDYRNRVEHPTMGVFLQPDPIGFKGDAANLYRFCTNNAVNRIDPDGLLDTSGTTEYSTLTSWFGGDWIKGSDGLSASDWNHKRDQPAGMIMALVNPQHEGPKNDNRLFQSDVRGYAAQRGFQGVDPVQVGHAVASDATEAAKETAKDIRRDQKGYYGVERTNAEYFNGGRLHKAGPDVGVNSRYNPSGYLPNPPNGLSAKALFSGSHSHGPQSGRSLEGGDVPSANGANRLRTPYISSVARSTDPTRVSVYVPTSGRFYHTTNGGDTFLLGR